MEYILLLLGLFLLIKGADIFIDGAASVAARFKVPTLIIGLTVVSFGTSAPEAAISISASLSGANSLLLGNVIGSNFFNLLMVVGITAFVIPLKADKEVIDRDMPTVILATGGLAVIILDGIISRIDALILLAALGIYLFAVIKKALSSAAEAEEKRVHSWFLSLLYVSVGLASVVCGGDIVVDNAKVIAADFGMSETLIGLTVVALGTSLPELVTSVVAAKKGARGIAIGNAVGSCLFNILFILGLSGIVKPIGIDSELIADVGLLAAASMIVFIFMAKGRRVGRLEGAVCILLYAAYTAFIILRAYGFV